MSLDAFNVVAGIVTIASFLFAVVLYIQDRALKRSIEAGLIGLIGTLDALAYVAKGTGDSDAPPSAGDVRLKLLGYAVACRNHAISLLKSFSDKEERFKTFDFGLSGSTPKERLLRRDEEFTCALYGEQVHTPNGYVRVDALNIGDSVLAYDLLNRRIVVDEVTRKRSAEVKQHIRLNGTLSVTPSHEVWCFGRGWTRADCLHIGDMLMADDGDERPITSIELMTKDSEVVALSVKTHACFFVGGYLAHNK